MKVSIQKRIIGGMIILLAVGGCRPFAIYQDTDARPANHGKSSDEFYVDDDIFRQFLAKEGDEKQERKIEEMDLVELDPAALRFLSAERYYNERKFNECIDVLNDIFKIDPLDIEGNLLLGRVFLARGENKEAILQFERVLNINPESAEAHYWLGFSYARSGDFEAAYPLLRQAESLNMDFAEPKLTIAELYLKAGNRAEAAEILEMLIEKWPDFIPSYILLGTFYMSGNQPREALETFAKIEKADPENPSGPYYMGLVFKALNMSKEANIYFEKALALFPEYTDALEQIIDLEWAENSPVEALERVKLQTSDYPNSADLQFVLGNVYSKMGDPISAASAYITAVKLNPGHIKASIRLSRIYLETGQHEEAIKQFDKVLEKSTDDRDAQMIGMLKGVALESMGDIMGAKRSYETVLYINPSHYQAANNLAYLYTEHFGENDKAHELARHAHDLAPHDPFIMDTLGWVLYKKREYQQALTLLTDSASKLDKNPEVLFHLGMVHYKLGNIELARDNLTKAIEINPGFRNAEVAKRVLREF